MQNCNENALRQNIQIHQYFDPQLTSLMFKFLGVIDLIHCSKSCIYWKNILDNQKFWRSYAGLENNNFSIDELKKTLAQLEISAIAPYLPTFTNYPNLFKDINYFQSRFMITREQSNTALKKVSDDIMRKTDEIKLLYLPLMRRYFCHPSILSFEQNCDLAISMLNRDVWQLVAQALVNIEDAPIIAFSLCEKFNLPITDFFELMVNQIEFEHGTRRVKLHDYENVIATIAQISATLPQVLFDILNSIANPKLEGWRKIEILPVIALFAKFADKEIPILDAQTIFKDKNIFEILSGGRFLCISIIELCRIYRQDSKKIEYLQNELKADCHEQNRKLLKELLPNRMADFIDACDRFQNRFGDSGLARLSNHYEDLTLLLSKIDKQEYSGLRIFGMPTQFSNSQKPLPTDLNNNPCPSSFDHHFCQSIQYLFEMLDQKNSELNKFLLSNGYEDIDASCAIDLLMLISVVHQPDLLKVERIKKLVNLYSCEFDIVQAFLKSYSVDLAP